MLFYGKSDVGAVRAENQDCFGIYELMPGITLCVVCDGMGGAAGGSEASRLALDTFADMMRETLIPDNPDDRADLRDASVRQNLADAVYAANRAVFEKADENEEKYAGMGTTLVGLLTVGNAYAWSINVGDSRLYRIDANGITRMTKDHSYVQQLVDSGTMTPDEATVSPMRNMITRAVGAESSVEADIKWVDMSHAEEERGYFMLCSDGLYVCVSEDKILEIVNGSDSLQVKTERLVKAALAAGAPDNVSVILAEI